MRSIFIIFFAISIVLSNPLEKILTAQDNSENNQIENIIEKNNYIDNIIKNTIQEIVNNIKKDLDYGMTLKRENQILHELNKILNNQETKIKIKNDLYEQISNNFTIEEINSIEQKNNTKIEIINKNEKTKLVNIYKKEIERIFFQN